MDGVAPIVGSTFLTNALILGDEKARRAAQNSSDSDAMETDSRKSKRKSRSGARVRGHEELANMGQILLREPDFVRCCGSDASIRDQESIRALLMERGALATTQRGHILDTQAFLFDMVMQSVYDILKKKFNLYAIRIFRLLMSKKYAEEKEISRQVRCGDVIVLLKQI